MVWPCPREEVGATVILAKSSATLHVGLEVCWTVVPVIIQGVIVEYDVVLREWAGF